MIVQGCRFNIVHVVGDIPASFANTACEPETFSIFVGIPKMIPLCKDPRK
jgi:hypothetical protein